MIKIENKSPEEIAEIGREIGKAFAAEKDGIVKLLTEEQTIKAFEIMTECFYRKAVGLKRPCARDFLLSERNSAARF